MSTNPDYKEIGNDDTIYKSDKKKKQFLKHGTSAESFFKID